MSILVEKPGDRANPPSVTRRSPSAPGGGEPPRFDDIYHERFGYLWDVGRRLGVQHGELDDVLQEVFVQVHRSLHTFDPSRPLLPWLHGIAANVVRTHLRRSRRHQKELLMEDMDAAEPFDLQPNPEQIVAAKRSRDLVIELMQKLDFDRRVVLSMHDFDGITMADIVGVLEITIEAGYKRLEAARRDLREAVARHLARARVRGLSAVVPLDAGGLLDFDRAIPDAPAGAQERVWSQLQGALDLGTAGAVASAAPSIAAHAAAAIVPYVAPFVLGVVTGAAGLHLLRPRAPTPKTEVVAVNDVAVAVATASPAAPAATAATAPSAAAVVMTAAAGTPAVRNAPFTTDEEEDLLREARTAAASRRWKRANDALDAHARRFRQGQLAKARDMLRAQIVEAQRVTDAPSSAAPTATAAPNRLFGTDP